MPPPGPLGVIVGAGPKEPLVPVDCQVPQVVDQEVMLSALAVAVVTNKAAAIKIKVRCISPSIVQTATVLEGIHFGCSGDATQANNFFTGYAFGVAWPREGPRLGTQRWAGHPRP